MYILMYESYFESGSPYQMSWTQLVSYLWLGQSCFCLIYNFIDSDIFDSIRNGQVAYELIRPFSIYWYWFSKIVAGKAAKALLRFWPVLFVAIILPSKYALSGPVSSSAFILFLITLFLGFILAVSLNMIIYMIVFFTTSSRGIFNAYAVITELFSGHTLPVVFMPKVFQTIAYILPFRLSVDLPFRIYVGSISINEGISQMFVQIIWIAISILIGNLLMINARKKLVIQGG